MAAGNYIEVGLSENGALKYWVINSEANDSQEELKESRPLSLEDAIPCLVYCYQLYQRWWTDTHLVLLNYLHEHPDDHRDYLTLIDNLEELINAAHLERRNVMILGRVAVTESTFASICFHLRELLVWIETRPRLKTDNIQRDPALVARELESYHRTLKILGVILEAIKMPT